MNNQLKFYFFVFLINEKIYFWKKNLALFNENQSTNSLNQQNFNRLNTIENRSSLNHLNIGRNPKLVETSSLRSFNSSYGDSSSLLSLNVALNSDSHGQETSLVDKQNNSHIAENYLLLERLNQRQRQKQLLQSKKDLHRQQLNELKHKQLNLEQKFIQAKNRELESDSQINFPFNNMSNNNDRISPSSENKLFMDTNLCKKPQSFQKSNTFSNETINFFFDPNQNLYTFPMGKSTDLLVVQESINEKNSNKQMIFIFENTFNLEN
ncbi:hypothetical protein BpHYR1_004507 [Brachionus plicatilis]|uniref:Uncharacterized protein n=1 Tax=Brachionus plicatilis TaxID=10195 RepID=A0A3M7SJR6_BRAPC|nr:hypothetical protein BpHYR1_004507 [Brachionus plicatilis]